MSWLDPMKPSIDLSFTPEPAFAMRSILEDAPEGWLGDPDWPSLFMGSKANDVYVYCEFLEDEFGDLEINLLSSMPDVGRRQGHQTWLEFELGQDGLATMLGLDHDAGLRYALEHGLCPGQWFVLKLKPHYWEGWCGDSYEYDFEVDFDLISAQHLALAEHTCRWQKYAESLGLVVGVPT